MNNNSKPALKVLIKILYYLLVVISFILKAGAYIFIETVRFILSAMAMMFGAGAAMTVMEEDNF